MDPKLINSIVRVCQSEFVRHYPNDLLLGYLESHSIGRWSGDTYQLTPTDKKALADNLLKASGVDAFSPEVGGTFMMGKVAHLSSQQEIAEVSEPRVVMLRTLNTGHIVLPGIDVRLSPGTSLSVPYDLEAKGGSHHAVILCQHYAVYEKIELSQLVFDDIGFNPLVVFNGATASQRDSVARFLQVQRLPVHCAFDLSPEGLRLALDVPAFGSYLLPPKEMLDALMARHNKNDLYLSQVARVRNDFHDTQGQIKHLWEQVITHEICISSKSYLPDAHPPANAATSTCSAGIGLDDLTQALTNPIIPAKPMQTAKKAQRVVTEKDLALFKSVVDDKTQPVLLEKARFRAKGDDSQTEVTPFVQYKIE
jgi:hypothetical protein